MSMKSQLLDVRYIGSGAISFVYKVRPGIAVKIRKPNDEKARMRFRMELKIYDTIAPYDHPCLIRSFLRTEDAIFLEYTPNGNLFMLLEKNVDRDPITNLPTVKRIEPLALRLRWICCLAEGVAFLETLNLAHGDLRPDNVLIEGDRLKLCDFDNASEFGHPFKACVPPVGRILGPEAGPDQIGSPGRLGPRTEQFALGSIIYHLSYGHEVYGDRHLTRDPHDHGPRVVELLQQMIFPALDKEPELDDVIERCWHNRYATIADIVTHLHGISFDGELPDSRPSQQKSIKSLTAKQAICRDLESGELLTLLRSKTPHELCLPIQWQAEIGVNAQ